MFSKADKDGSGDLNMAEFQVCLKDAELGLTKKEARPPARQAPWPRHRHHHHLLLLLLLLLLSPHLPATAAARLAC